MKGIVLAGGSGSRLYPLTQVTSKQLLPVYDKPMICYPISTLMLMGIKDILIISTPEDTPIIMEYLKDGSNIGVNFEYKIQAEPKGIAEAFTLGADFIDGEDVCLILGDNIFYMGDQIKSIAEQAEKNQGATIVSYRVADPERFGVVETDEDGKVISLEEKPKNPKSNYAAVGLYFYNNDVVEKARNLKPSARGELEITDLNNVYLKEGRMSATPMKRGTAWLDAGTPESLLEASMYIGMLEQRQGLKIACLEEIAYRRGFIDTKQMKNIIADIKDGVNYQKYLKRVLTEI